MMASQITIERIAFDEPSAASQVITISHKLAADPDSSYIDDISNQNVGINGILNPSYIISGLAYDTWYSVRIKNSCGDGRVAYGLYKTGESPCPDIDTVFGYST